MTDELRVLDLDAIEVSPRNPRRTIDLQRLRELAASIAEYGVLEPVIVTPMEGAPGRYKLVAGERRWRASRLAGKRGIPSVIRTDDGRRLREIRLIENIERVQLSPLEEALELAAWQEDFGESAAALARRIKRSEEFVRGRLNLLKLPEQVQQVVAEGHLSLGAALELLAVGDGAVQCQIAQQAVQGRFTVAETKAEVRRCHQNLRLQHLRARRQERRADMIRALSAWGVVVTRETYDPAVHHRMWDLSFPACAPCPLKATFLRDDGQLEDVCVQPECYARLLAQQRQASRRSQEAHLLARHAAFQRVLDTEEVTLAHLQYLLWMQLQQMRDSIPQWRERAGLPTWESNAAWAEWKELSHWPYERLLTAIMEITVGHLASLPNSALPAGLRASLVSQFGLPPGLLYDDAPPEGHGAQERAPL